MFTSEKLFAQQVIHVTLHTHGFYIQFTRKLTSIYFTLGYSAGQLVLHAKNCEAQVVLCFLIFSIYNFFFTFSVEKGLLSRTSEARNDRSNTPFDDSVQNLTSYLLSELMVGSGDGAVFLSVTS